MTAEDSKMYKKLAAIMGVLLILCSVTAMAQKEAATNIATASKIAQMDTSRMQLRMQPDLMVKSAMVTGVPFRYGDILIMPLQITIANNGAVTSADFNVGAVGSALDGNAYGFDYIVPGEATMAGRGGVLCSGLAAGAEKTYRGYLFMKPIRVGDAFQPGSRYKIEAMVDYNLDPDSGGYAWGVAESNENNNKLTINYP